MTPRIALSVAALTLLVAAVAGCESDGTTGGTGTLAPQHAPDDLVLRVAASGGFLTGYTEVFYVRRHGHRSVSVYGDGRVIHVSSREEETSSTRPYWTYRLDDEARDALLRTVAPDAVAAAAGQQYVTCGCLDCSTEVLTVARGDGPVTSTATPSFEGEQGCTPPEWAAARPPEGLDDLTAALWALRRDEGASYTGDKLVVAGCREDRADFAPCAAPPDAELPFDAGKALDLDCDGNGRWTEHAVTLTGDAAVAARAFVAEHRSDDPAFRGYPTAVVRQNGACLLLVWDEVFPDED